MENRDGNPDEEIEVEVIPNSSKSQNPMNFRGLNWLKPGQITGKYGLLNRLNYLTVILAFLHFSIVIIILIVEYISLSQVDPGNSTLNAMLIFKILIPGLFCIGMIVYDYIIASQKIFKLDLQNYGFDFILVGIMGSILLAGAGIWLFFKGCTALIIALTDSAIFVGKYRKPFREVFIMGSNLFGPLVGYAILIINNPWSNFIPNPNMFLFYSAIVCITAASIISFLFARKKKVNEIPLWLGIALLLLGSIASIYSFSGVYIGFWGFLISLVKLFQLNIIPKS